MKRSNRQEKYYARPRMLYALLFGNGCCYIGQSVDLKKRTARHRSPSGGWHRSFEVVPLGTCHGTRAQASDFEHAWRLAAVAHGWQVYAVPPGVLCNPARQASLRHHWLSWRLRWHWPIQHSRSWFYRLLAFFRPRT